MKTLPVYLSISLLFLVAAVDGRAVQLVSPIPVRPEHDPLPVQSPLRVAWAGQETMTVEIYRDTRLLFPASPARKKLVSGCTFQLDPGVYHLVLYAPSSGAISVSKPTTTTWIRIVPGPLEFDLRADAPATQQQVRDLQRMAKRTEDQVAAVALAVEDTSERLADIEDGLLLLLKQFTVVDRSGDKPVHIEQPLQWMADRLLATEAKHGKKP